MLLAALTSLFGRASLYRGSVVLLIVTEAALILVKHPGAAEVVALTVLSGLALAPIYPADSFVLSCADRQSSAARAGICRRLDWRSDAAVADRSCLDPVSWTARRA